MSKNDLKVIIMPRLVSKDENNYITFHLENTTVESCGVIAMLVGFIIVPIVSLFSKKPDKDFIDDAFSCYEEQVSVHKKTSLGN